MRVLLILLFLANLLSALTTCSERPGAASEASMDGEALARLHCGGCHAFPEPNRLDKATWREGVLPHMALRLGWRDSIPLRQTMEEGLAMRRAGMIPSEPLVDSVQWSRIVAYFLEHAPATLEDPPVPAPQPLPDGRLRAQSLDLGLDGAPLTTLVHWAPNNKRLYLGEGTHNLFQYDGSGRLQEAFGLESPPVAMAADGRGGTFVLSIGHIHPNDEPRGTLSYLDSEGRMRPVLQQLPRPVDLAVGDLDGDGRQDLVIAGFGHYRGRLSWWKGLGGLRFEERVLLDQAGALSTYIRDLNDDGRPDILSLMAQGDERIVAHIQSGDGQFQAQTLLRFDPVQGSSFMQPLDLDRDGDLDLIYTNGDNADYSFTRKPYHGLHVFEQTGPLQFEEAFFYPLHGATKAVPFRFGRDSIPDLAVIAFFPDFDQRPVRALLLFEQEEGASLSFTPQLVPGMERGRWLTLDTGDLDGNGLDDLVLGSFTFSPTPTPNDLYRAWLESREDVLLLFQQADPVVGARVRSAGRSQ